MLVENGNFHYLSSLSSKPSAIRGLIGYSWWYHRKERESSKYQSYGWLGLAVVDIDEASCDLFIAITIQGAAKKLTQRTKRGWSPTQLLGLWERGRKNRQYVTVSQKRCKMTIVTMRTNTKSHARFRLVPKSSTLDDLEWPKRTLVQKRCVFWSILDKLNEDRPILSATKM